VGAERQRLFEGRLTEGAPEGVHAADELRGPRFVLVDAVSEAPLAAGEVERRDLGVEEEDVELLGRADGFEARDEVVLHGAERGPLHAVRTVEHVDEPRADPFDAEEADPRLTDRELRSAARGRGAASGAAAGRRLRA